MEEIQNIFPNFVPNQVLTSDQLNALRNYLDQQDRLGRIRLSGTGILCGLSIKRLGKSGPIMVNGGFGISSDGYLIEHSGGRYSHYRSYTDPGNNEDGIPGYTTWKQRPALRTQIPLLELLESKQKPGDKALTEEKLKDRVILLYLEIDEEEMRSCLVTDCNNNGSKTRLNIRTLLVRESDLAQQASGKAAPQTIELPRLHTAVPLTSITTTSKLNGGYSQIIESVLPNLATAIKEGISRYNHILPLGKRVANPVKPFEKILKKAINNGEINQYHYDLVADVATAFNEFIILACRWISDCQASTSHPRHLMLDHTEGTEYFRHHFHPATIRGHWQGDTLRVTQLLQRLLMLLESIETGSAKETRVTPSHGEDKQLGERAIPHYFRLTSSASTLWHPNDGCASSLPWSYHHKEEAMERDYRRCSLLRIEGHTGQKRSDGRLKISTLRRQHNAEFDLLVLYLEGRGKREKALFELLATERTKWVKAEKEMVILLSKTVESENFRPAAFTRSYAKIAGTVRLMAEKVTERKHELTKLRTERKPLCNLNHLEADYGGLRVEIVSLLHRLSSTLEATDQQHIPPMQTLTPKARESSIKEAAKNIYSLANRIKNEDDRTKRRKLLAERLAAESAKVNLEAEGALLLKARRSTTAIMARTPWTKSGNIELTASTAAEKIKLIRADSIESTVQLAEQVTIAALQHLLEQLIAHLPEQLIAFDPDAYMALFKQLVSDLIELRLNTLVKLMISISRSGMEETGSTSQALLEVLAENLRLEEQDMQHMIMSVMHDSRPSRLIYLHHLYLHHRADDNSDFANFASRHPGMEHLAGVTKGGTFILVAENDTPDAEIIADFSLHGKVSCCCRPPTRLCLPPVAMPDYRIVPLHLDSNGDAYLPVVLDIDLLRNDFSLNAEKSADNTHLRRVKLRSEKSELGAELQLNNLTGQVTYKLQGATAGAVDRFDYQLTMQGNDCSGEDNAQVLILLVPRIKPRPQLGEIGGYVSWRGNKEPDVIITIKESGRTATTKSKGHYLFKNLPAGDYTLTATLWGGEVTSDPKRVSVAAGERTSANFILPKNQQSMVGSLAASVIDATTKKPLKGATALLFNAAGKAVAETDEITSNGLYTLDNIAVGSYTLSIRVSGYYPYTEESVAIKNNTITSRLIPLTLKKRLFVPERTVGYVAVIKDLDDDSARKKLVDAYAERQGRYMAAIAKTREEQIIRDSDAYARSDKFVSKTLLNPNLSEEEIINAYKAVSRDVADSVASADDAQKERYRSLLENVSKAFMDRVSLSNPEEITPKAEAALVEMNNTITAAGIDAKVMSKSWKGDELSTGLRIRSADSISALARRR